MMPVPINKRICNQTRYSTNSWYALQLYCKYFTPIEYLGHLGTSLFGYLIIIINIRFINNMIMNIYPIESEFKETLFLIPLRTGSVIFLNPLSFMLEYGRPLTVTISTHPSIRVFIV